MRTLFAAAALFAVTASGGLAQEGAPAGTPAEDRVTVTGQTPDETLRERVSSFVEEVGAPISSNFGFARWDRFDRLCVGVENIQADIAQYVVDRISLAALDVGLRIGEPGCTPNIPIVFAADGAALARHLVQTEPAMFRPFHGAGGTTQGLHALDEFAASDAPVRWWQITMVVDRSGAIAIDYPQNDRRPCFGEIRICVDGANSRTTNAVRDELWAAYVIVDVSKLESVSWAQLADYLAMVTLAQIDPQAQPASHDTILNLFHAPGRAPGMTDWDRTYLRALYEFNQRRMPRNQPGALTSQMVRDIRTDE